MKSRIEIDEMGRAILVMPDDLIEEYQLEEGDVVTIYSEDGWLRVLL